MIPIDKKISISATEISIRTKLAMTGALIKAVADENNAMIVTGDRHFKNIENIKFIE